MYIVGILLACIFSIIVGPIDIVNSLKEGRIALAIVQIVITLLFIATAIIIFLIREYRGDFELDINDDDEAKTITLKTAGGYTLGFAVILVIVMWFCCLGNII